MVKFRYASQAAQIAAKAMPMLSGLNPDKVCFIIVKLRELDVQVEAPMGDSSNATDDRFAAVFTQSRDSSVRKEVVDCIGSMNEDEHRERIAPHLIGGEDFPVEELPSARAEAAAHAGPGAAAFLFGMPNPAGQLEEGLANFGFSCEAVEEGRL